MLGQHGLTPALYRAVVAVVDERTEMIRTLRQDFDRLTHAVGELAQAQARTEARMEELAQAQARTEARVEELAQAQARTEARVEELAQAQARTDASLQALAQAQARTEARVEELAQAQARSEGRLDRVEAALEQLAQAQARTDASLQALAQAQARTDASLQALAQAQARTEVAVGRLGEDIGFGLEDVARLLLPPYLHKHYGIQLAGAAAQELQPRFFSLPDRPPVEINLYGEGQRDGRKVIVLGEAKARIGGGVVKDFVDTLAQVEPLIEGEVWRVLFGYYIHPSAQPVAQEHGIVLVASYQR